MRKRTLLALAAATALMSAGTALAQDKTKACFIYVGPIGDFGWSYQHHQGALEMQEELGGEDKVEIAQPSEARQHRGVPLDASGDLLRTDDGERDQDPVQPEDDALLALGVLAFAVGQPVGQGVGKRCVGVGHAPIFAGRGLSCRMPDNPRP